MLFKDKSTVIGPLTQQSTLILKNSMLAVSKSFIRSLPKIQSGTSSYCQFLFLIQVISLLPDKLYPEIQSTSTSVPWSTGSDVTVFRPKLRLSDRDVHLSEKRELTSNE